MAALHLKLLSSHVASDSCTVEQAAPKTASQHRQNATDESNSIDDKSTTTAADKSEDPFLYYSDDTVRMHTLQLDGPAARTKKDTKSARRQSRISFELHPSAILDFDEMELYDDESGDIDGLAGALDFDLDDVTKTDMLPQMELLRDLLTM